jgi:hypothetical protein
VVDWELALEDGEFVDGLVAEARGCEWATDVGVPGAPGPAAITAPWP